MESKREEMENNRIAIITDSGTDVPQALVDRYNMYVVPLLVNYDDVSYRDGIDIDVNQICDRLKKEIPTTSLPSIDAIRETFDMVIADGYREAVVVTISSGLSGTFNAMRIVSDSYSDRLDVRLVNTLNIDIGAGFSAIRVGELIEQGLSLDEIEEAMKDAVSNTKVFFCVRTLEYLIKGGRIGLVAGAVGSMLDIKPIMSCNEDGVYYAVAKTRGRKKSLKRALKEAASYAAQFIEYNVAVVNVQCQDEADMIVSHIKDSFPGVKEIFLSAISPALIVHTGPGLIGIGVQKIK